jgi:hypothetical protein
LNIRRFRQMDFRSRCNYPNKANPVMKATVAAEELLRQMGQNPFRPQSFLSCLFEALR